MWEDDSTEWCGQWFTDQNARRPTTLKMNGVWVRLNRKPDVFYMGRRYPQLAQLPGERRFPFLVMDHIEDYPHQARTGCHAEHGVKLDPYHLEVWLSHHSATILPTVTSSHRWAMSRLHVFAICSALSLSYLQIIVGPGQFHLPCLLACHTWYEL